MQLVMKELSYMTASDYCFRTNFYSGIHLEYRNIKWNVNCVQKANRKRLGRSIVEENLAFSQDTQSFF